MSKLSIAVLVGVLSVASISYGQDSGYVYPQNGDPWNMVPPPSGMQFAPEYYGNYNYGGCSACGGIPCVHWTQVSWYASWPNDGWPAIHHHKKCGNNCGSNCGDNGNDCGCTN